ncbi:MAG: CDP-alcohol phosphatidyltransferase family protein, partial [Anaerotignaceae bacterium]
MNLPNKLTLLRVLLIPVFVFVLLSGVVASPMNR